MNEIGGIATVERAVQVGLKAVAAAPQRGPLILAGMGGYVVVE